MQRYKQQEKFNGKKTREKLVLAKFLCLKEGRALNIDLKEQDYKKAWTRI